MKEILPYTLTHTHTHSGACGSGKSFTADQLLVKMFQNTQRTDWLQDIRKVNYYIITAVCMYTRN